MAMAKEEPAATLRQVIDRLAEAGEGESVSVDDVMEALGRRSFAPLLLAPSLLLVSPLSGIPGAGTTGALVIALIALQLMLGRDRLWLPGFLLRSSVGRARFRKAMAFLRPGARVVDRVIRPRLVVLTRGVFPRVIGAVCLAIAAMMPPLELVPMANSLSASAVAASSLALVAHDGLLVLLALAASGVALWYGLGFLL